MKQSVNKDAFIVTVSILVSKLLGILFVFPFSRIVGIDALSLYSYAYVPLTLFLDLSTLGIPHGTSKFVSKYYTNEEEEVIHYQFKYTAISLVLLSVIFFIVLFLLAPLYAKASLGGQDLTNTVEDVTKAIRIVGVLILVVPVLSLYRGYFYGKKVFIVSGFSQIIEQFIRVSFILVSSYIIINIFGLEYKIAIYYALVGAIVAGILTLLFMILSKKIINRSVKLNEDFVYDKKYFRELISYSYPFIVTGICFTMLSVVDSITFNKGLIKYGVDNPEIYYGIYSFQVQKLVFIPVSISLGYSASLLSRLTEYSEDEHNEVIKTTVSNSYSYVINVIVPIILVVIVNSETIYSILYEKNDIGPTMLKLYIIQVLPISLYNITNSVIQSLNKGRYMIPIMIGILIIKYILNILLIQEIGYFGAILSTFISLTIVIICGLTILKRNNYIELFGILKGITKITIGSLIIGIFAYYINDIFDINKYIVLILNSILLVPLFIYTLKRKKVEKHNK